tara:strand:- start:2087 stop:2557 length:471 start_codon:yes stop_codon:yes gene_type:complete
MNDNIEKAQANLIQVILANTTSAMNISSILCEHSSDKILKSDEVICGLIYRLMIPMTDDEIRDSMSIAESLMYEESSDDDDDVDDVDDVDDDDVDDDIVVDECQSRSIRTNNCNCDICSQVRVCLCNFKDYLPKDELGDKFKESILTTCLTHNKII